MIVLPNPFTAGIMACSNLKWLCGPIKPCQTWRILFEVGGLSVIARVCGKDVVKGKVGFEVGKDIWQGCCALCIIISSLFLENCRLSCDADSDA